MRPHVDGRHENGYNLSYRSCAHMNSQAFQVFLDEGFFELRGDVCSLLFGKHALFFSPANNFSEPFFPDFRLEVESQRPGEDVV